MGGCTKGVNGKKGGQMRSKARKLNKLEKKFDSEDEKKIKAWKKEKNKMWIQEVVGVTKEKDERENKNLNSVRGWGGE